MASAASLPVYMMPGVSVSQPAHLEGDPALATEILPGPPSLLSVQQSALKRDPKKPPPCYLPATDPGTSYQGVQHGTIPIVPTQAPDLTVSKRSSDKVSTNRAQRASARGQVGRPSAVNPGPPTVDSASAGPSRAEPDDDDVMTSGRPRASRSASAQNLHDVPKHSVNGTTRRNDKGKGREVYPQDPIVKEEPRPASLQPSDLNPILRNNEDHCSACRFLGDLIYCDGCPRAYHFWCLDPPMESDAEAGNQWFCHSCVVKKKPPPKLSPSLFAPLHHLAQISPPKEYQLPEEIRTFFKDVGSSARGAYVDSSEQRISKPNRFGQIEDRDPHRLRDRNGSLVVCHKCGSSALPDSAAMASSSKRLRRHTEKGHYNELWKNMLSCDYCDLHWHLDCLTPPLTVMPKPHKKWMCPNHVEKIVLPKLRIPKQHSQPIEIKKRNQFNNGNIEISHINYPPKSKVKIEEQIINGRRYRVPEKIVVLDFWSKIGGPGAPPDMDDDDDSTTTASSPLTSLSSSDDIPPYTQLSSATTDEDRRAAQILCALRGGDVLPSELSPSFSPLDGTASAMQKSRESSGGAPGKATELVASSIGNERASTSRQTSHQQLDKPTTMSNGSSKRRKPIPMSVQVGPSSRELRSRGNSQLPFVKVEQTDESSLLNSELSLSAPMSKPNSTRRVRVLRAARSADNAQSLRGLKRKFQDDDPSEDSDRLSGPLLEESSSLTRGKGRLRRPASKPISSSSQQAALNHSSPSKTAPNSSSLKIRLPALNSSILQASGSLTSTTGSPSASNSR